MNVLITLSYYLPNISGLTNYIKNLSEGLVCDDHQVTILTSRFKKNLVRSETVNKIRIKRTWTPFILGRGPIMPTYPIEAFVECLKADIVNIHIPQFEGFFLAIICKILHKKLIVTHHCDLSQWPGLLNIISEKATYLSLLITCLLADSIVVYTKDYANHSNFLKHFKNKLIYLLPPVKFEVSTKKLKAVNPIVKYKIGFAGRIAREKGIEYLINAIPYLKKEFGENFKIYLVGPGKEVIGGGYKSQLSDLIEKYKNYLVFLGPLNSKQMAIFYRSIDVLVLPSTERLESFGFVQIEAMLSGCPVVASDLPGVRVPVGLSKMGEIVSIRNSKELACKILRVLRNKKSYVKNYKKVSAIFNWRDTISKYEKIFKGISK